jgi:hypothetical protein
MTVRLDDITNAVGGAVRRALEPDEDAQRLRQARVSNPVGAVHAAPASTARKIYTEDFGLTVASTYGQALRHMTPAEGNALDTASTDHDAVFARRTRLIPGDTQQLRIELDRSQLVAVRFPAGAESCSAYGVAPIWRTDLTA